MKSPDSIQDREESTLSGFEKIMEEKELYSAVVSHSFPRALT